MDKTSSITLLSTVVCFFVTFYSLSTMASVHLTDSEKLAIRSTIDMFKTNLTDNMVVFYQTLFDDHPKYHRAVPSLRNVKTSDFPKNEFIRDQKGPQTGASIVDLVSKMEDTEQMKQTVLDMLGSRSTMKLKTRDYANAFDALLKTFSKQFGATFTPSDAAAWKTFTTNVLQLIDEELKHNKN